MRSIKQKILVQVLALVVAAAVICGGVGIAATYVSSFSMLEQTLRSTATLAADRAAYELEAYRGEVEALGMVPELSDDTVSVAKKEQIVNQWVELYHMERGNLLNRSGDSLFDGNNYSEREYFQRALQGEAWISTPTVSKIDGELSIMVAAPVWEDGVAGGTVAGVVYFIPDKNFLNNIMTSIQISENSGAYMIDSTGLTIADTTLDTVAVENIEQEAQSDPSLARLAAHHAEMRAGNSGYGRYSIDGTEKCLAYAPVSDTNGWSIAITAPTSDFLGTTYMSTLAAVILLVVILALAAVLSVRMAKGIGDPIKACAERLALVDTGDLSSPVPEFNTKDEVGTLSRATTGIVTNLQELIGDVDRLLDEMAKGNFNVRSRNYDLYQGDYTNLLESVRNININLSETLSQINQAADQVSAGAEQVSSGAQSLAQGATEQASAVEELSATVSEIDSSAETNARAATQSREKSGEAAGQVHVSAQKMEALQGAMGDILQGHQEIAQIIETIENIAFQTNILALNAAVEAARAGSSGKGFAVVADEVRTLAGKTAGASQNTAELIERAMAAVKNGKQIADDTAASFRSVHSGISEVSERTAQVGTETEKQKEALQQTTAGVERISSIVQTSSATAEESAAASQELSSQAHLLRELTGKFILPDQGA